MTTVNEFTPFEDDEDEDGGKAMAGETPGTKALVEACKNLEDTLAHEALMAAPGTVPQTPDVFPHSLECEERLLKAAALIKEATEHVLAAKGGK